MARCLGADAGGTAAFSNGDRQTHLQENTEQHWLKERQGTMVRVLVKRLNLIKVSVQRISKNKPSNAG